MATTLRFRAEAARWLLLSGAPMLTLVRDGGKYALHAFGAPVKHEPLAPINQKRPGARLGDDWSEAIPVSVGVLAEVARRTKEELFRREAELVFDVTPHSIAISLKMLQG